jgi:hypothetical protein
MDDVRIYNRALSSSEVAQLALNSPPPVAEFKFEEGSGTTAKDTSGNGNNGTVNGATWVTGKTGKAMQFNGATNYVQIPDSSSLNFVSKEYTISAWINMSSVPNDFRRIFDKSQASFPNGYGLDLSKNYLRLLGSTNMSFNSPNWLPNTWYQVAATYDGATTGKLYINGVLKISSTYAAINAHTGTAQIGKASDATAFFPGLIDNVRIYNYARTPAQIAEDYNGGDPIAHWKFDECTGTTIHDSSPNRYDGSLTIGATGTQTSAGTCTSGSTVEAWNNGKSGETVKAIKLDGTDDFVTINNLNVPIYALHINAKVGFAPSNGDLFVDFVNPLGLGITSGGWTGNLTNESLTIWSSDSKATAISNTVSSSVWTDVIIAWNGTKYDFYLNGIKQVTQAHATGGDAQLITASSILLGKFYNGVTNYYGDLKFNEVSIYSYPLTADQVKTVFNNGSVKFGN